MHASAEPSFPPSQSAEVPPVASSSKGPSPYAYATPSSAQPLARGASAFGLSQAGPHPGPQSSEGQGRAVAELEAQHLMDAIRASLDPANNVKPSPAPVLAASVQSADRSQADKGKEPVRTPLRSPSPQIHTIESIEAEFVKLSYEFVFPLQVDFSPSDSDSATTPHLAYTHGNTVIWQYENALNGLLTKVDAVETLGVAEVRAARKELVKRIEGALEGLEARKGEAWRKEVGGGAAVLGYDVERVEEEKEKANEDVSAAAQETTDSSPGAASHSSAAPLGGSEANASSAVLVATPGATSSESEDEASSFGAAPLASVGASSAPAAPYTPATASASSDAAAVFPAPTTASNPSPSEPSKSSDSSKGTNGAEFVML